MFLPGRGCPPLLPERPIQVPLGELAEVKIAKGPTVIKSEEGMLTAYVYVDFRGRDLGGYVNEAEESVRP